MHRSGAPALEEERLVTLCLQGQDSAWETLLNRYHPRLVARLRYLIGGVNGADRAEEIAATVWFTLCSQGYSPLQRYDPRVGRLLDYLVGMARKEIWRRRRTAQTRQARERKVARTEASLDDTSQGLVIQEFLATLTRREREFCVSHLLSQVKPAGQPPVSSTNAWQLRSRVLKKFRAFFLHNS
jgi:DNA-directed RNA polymerase specialized sigma24 family protein